MLQLEEYYRRWVVLPAACSIIICGVAMFGVNVLRRSLSDRARALHASKNMYELDFCPSGMSGYALSMKHGVGGRKVYEHDFQDFHHSCSTSHPGGNLVDCLPPAASNGGLGEGPALESKHIYGGGCR